MRKSAHFRDGIFTPIFPITGKRSLFPQSYILTPCRPHLHLAYLPQMAGEIRTYQVPYKQLMTNLGFAHLPAVLCPCNPIKKKINRPLTFWLKPVNILWLLFCHDSAAIHLCYPYWSAKPPNRVMLAIVVRTSRFELLFRWITLSERLRTKSLLITHALLGYYQRNDRFRRF